MRREKIKDYQKYHVYDRGFNKMMIFVTAEDLRRFERKMAYYSERSGVRIQDYALMGNHYHFLLMQVKGGSISKFMQRFKQSFATYFNIKYRRMGPVFEGRFKAKPITDMSYYLEIQKYIARNPVKVKTKIGENYSVVGFS